MAKTKGKKATAKKTEKDGKKQTKAAEYVSCLLELHSLQGSLLNQLSKEV
jgi:hypothetical protein